MRYLTENNEYDIQYFRVPYFLSDDSGVIQAFLTDKKTFNVIEDREIFYDDLEKCLMKLGKRLIEKWQNPRK